MLTKYFSNIRKYVLSVASQSKYTFYHQNTLLDTFRANSRKAIGRNSSMVIPLLANQDLTPMLPLSLAFKPYAAIAPFFYLFIKDISLLMQNLCYIISNSYGKML